jgi:hypothetical protein
MMKHILKTLARSPHFAENPLKTCLPKRRKDNRHPHEKCCRKFHSHMKSGAMEEGYPCQSLSLPLWIISFILS